MTHTENSVKSIAWASLKISVVLFLMRLLLVFISNGITETLEKWYVEVGYFIFIFVLMFLALVFISYFDKKQSEKEN